MIVNDGRDPRVSQYHDHNRSIISACRNAVLWNAGPCMTVVSSRLLMMTDGMKIPWLFIFFCAFSVIAQHLKKL